MMFGAFGILDAAGNPAYATESLGAPAARVGRLCDPAKTAEARPVPICSNWRREIELIGPEPLGVRRLLVRIAGQDRVFLESTGPWRFFHRSDSSCLRLPGVRRPRR
jgi:hypothetical protein